MNRLGLIVNPIAGMGGSVGLKGTDGVDAPQRAISLGAHPSAHQRAVEALSVIAAHLPDITLLTCAGVMGEDAAIQCGLPYDIVGGASAVVSRTTAEDTKSAAMDMRRYGVDLLLFAGGDGTARDICDVMSSNGASEQHTPALGIPAGVKMHSGVFGITPLHAGQTAVRFLRGELSGVVEAEVMDIDEAAFQGGVVSAQLYGYLRVPQDYAVQSTKSGGTGHETDAANAIAQQVIADMDAGTLYIIGPGTTTRAITDLLGLSKTLLGVDVVLNGCLLAADVNEAALLQLTLGRQAKIVVTAIGGQGYILGRGNQQLSARLIRQVGVENIIVVSTHRKLVELRGKPLLVDTGDRALDESLSGYVRVVTGLGEWQVHKVAC